MLISPGHDRGCVDTKRAIVSPHPFGLSRRPPSHRRLVVQGPNHQDASSRLATNSTGAAVGHEAHPGSRGRQLRCATLLHRRRYFLRTRDVPSAATAQDARSPWNQEKTTKARTFVLFNWRPNLTAHAGRRIQTTLLHNGTGHFANLFQKYPLLHLIAATGRRRAWHGRNASSILTLLLQLRRVYVNLLQESENASLLLRQSLRPWLRGVLGVHRETSHQR